MTGKHLLLVNTVFWEWFFASYYRDRVPSMLVNLFEQLLILPAKKDSILLNALRARI
jgi:hypothetical protein